MGIYLHPKLGVNPKLTFCRRCGAEVNELVLIGSKTGKYKCGNCGLLMFGGRPGVGERCPNCKGRREDFSRVGEIGEWERLPASELCGKCAKEVEHFRQEVEAGGVYWRCHDCKSQGVIKKSPFADRVRVLAGIPTGPCGVELSKERLCPKCGQMKDDSKD